MDTEHRGMADRPCRLAVASSSPDLEGEIMPLGRCRYFVIFEGSPQRRSSVPNPVKDRGAGSGAEAARALVGMGIDIVITDTIGAHALAVLTEGGLTVHAGCSGTVADAVDRCLEGKLPDCTGPTYSGYIGI